MAIAATEKESMKPRLLDLFCGAGGAGMGYYRAGFEVVGVDLKHQPEYPFKSVLGDALEILRWSHHYHAGWKHFDAIHASPPCQHWTIMQRQQKNSASHPDLVTPLRPLLEATGLPYVIENVETCDALIDPVLICGSMFDMDVRRHRLFETNWDLQPPEWPCRHKIWSPHRYPGTPNGSGKRPGAAVVNPMAKGTSHDMFAKAIEVDWVPSEGRFRPNQTLNDMIPPRYTQFIGEQLLAHIGAPVG